MEDPQEDPLAVHCFCVCSGSVLLGDLLGVSRSSREHDLLSVLFIYPRFLCICSLCIVAFFVFVFRSTSKSRPNNIRGGKCPYIRTSVRPSTKSFFDLNEIWYVGRGR